MKENHTESLPDYERPPVIEVVYGFQFKPLPKFKSADVGLFWLGIRNDYPEYLEMPPITPSIEQFDPFAQPVQPQIEVLSMPPLPRIFFSDPSGNWVLQLQKDRFLHNWRKVKDDDVYPRYPVVSQRFFDAWDKFIEFCRKEELGEPSINQLELTYINHIPLVEVKVPLEGIETIFPDLRWRVKHSFLPNPESLSWKTSFLLPKQQGRLHVSITYAFRRTDKSPVLLCELTARGMPSEVELSVFRKWFALSREWIVRGFADLTSEKIQYDIWRRKK